MSRFSDLMRTRTAHAAGIAGAFVLTSFLGGIQVISEAPAAYLLSTAEHFTAWFLMALVAAAVISACEVLMHPGARRIAIQAALLVASVFLLARFVTTSDLLTVQYRAMMGMDVDSSLFLYGLWLGWAISALMSWYYWASERALAAATALRGAEITRQRAQQRLLESRLRVLEAQVEPRFLLDTLSQLQQMYERDADHADRALDDLIDYLRARMLAAAQPRNEAITTH